MEANPMFTGIIEELGEIAGIERSGDGILFTVGAKLVLEGTRIGDSISINGACLTVTSLSDRSFTVFASSVTETSTTLGSYSRGKPVNLERAMAPSGRFGGHFVQGHVDGTGKVASVKRGTGGSLIEVAAGDEIKRYVVAKGSVAVDGVSLTVVSLMPQGFSLYLIPETLARTVASNWKPGDLVNIEVDILAKYVERMLDASARGGGSRPDDEIIMKKLADGGFV
jgi:riboflavin synthase